MEHACLQSLYATHNALPLACAKLLPHCQLACAVLTALTHQGKGCASLLAARCRELRPLRGVTCVLWHDAPGGAVTLMPCHRRPHQSCARLLRAPLVASIHLCSLPAPPAARRPLGGGGGRTRPPMRPHIAAPWLPHSAPGPRATRRAAPGQDQMRPRLKGGVYATHWQSRGGDLGSKP